MRINGMQKNNTNFKSLYVANNPYWNYNSHQIESYGRKLAGTKFVDLIIDSHGLAIKKKMTDILQRIQSFSLFPKENSVAINMIGEKNPIYKFTFKTLQEAKANWDYLTSLSKNSSLNEYTEVTLWLEKQLENINRSLY